MLGGGERGCEPPRGRARVQGQEFPVGTREREIRGWGCSRGRRRRAGVRQKGRGSLEGVGCDCKVGVGMVCGKGGRGTGRLAPPDNLYTPRGPPLDTPPTSRVGTGRLGPGHGADYQLPAHATHAHARARTRRHTHERGGPSLPIRTHGADQHPRRGSRTVSRHAGR